MNLSVSIGWLKRNTRNLTPNTHSFIVLPKMALFCSFSIHMCNVNTGVWFCVFSCWWRSQTWTYSWLYFQGSTWKVISKLTMFCSFLYFSNPPFSVCGCSLKVKTLVSRLYIWSACGTIHENQQLWQIYVQGCDQKINFTCLGLSKLCTPWANKDLLKYRK